MNNPILVFRSDELSLSHPGADCWHHASIREKGPFRFTRCGIMLHRNFVTEGVIDISELKCNECLLSEEK